MDDWEKVIESEMRDRMKINRTELMGGRESWAATKEKVNS